MSEGYLLPGQEVDPSVYMGMAAYGIMPPDGLLECNGMAEGFVCDTPDGIDSYGRELYSAFGMDAEGRCYYLGLTPMEESPCRGPRSDDMVSVLEDMRMDWILGGGSDPLDTRDALMFLSEYCTRFGIQSEDYGELLSMIPGDSMVGIMTEGLPQEDWDADTAMLMHDRAALLRYRRR